MKIVSIDSERFFGKELSEQNLVILFKRPIDADDNECESYCQELVKIVLSHGDNLSASDVIEYCDFNRDILEVIGSTLFIQSGTLDPITAVDILRRNNGSFYELLYEDQIIAKIQVKQKSPFLKKYFFLSFFFLLFILFVVGWCVNRIEENRLLSNQEAHALDSLAIDSLAILFDESISSEHSYFSYIQEQPRNTIAHIIESLRKEVEYNFQSVKEQGDYSPVRIDRQAIKSDIEELVEKAKELESAVLEKNRQKENRESYDKDMLTIGSLCDLLYSEASGVVPETDKRFTSVISTLDSLEKAAEASFRAVEFSGHYRTVCSNSDLVRRAIKDIVEETKKHNIIRRKSISSSNVSRGRTQKVTNTYPSSSKSNPREDRYNRLVKSANEDYTNYYMNGDVAVARRAYNNYVEALKIHYDSNLVNRSNKLKKELGL